MPRRYGSTAAAAATMAGALAPAAKSGFSQLSRMLTRDIYNKLSSSIGRKAKVGLKDKRYQRSRYAAHAVKLHRRAAVDGAQPANELIISKSNTLTSFHVTGLTQGDAIDQRERQIIFMNGFRLNFFLQNDDTTPMYGRWWVLQYRQAEGYSADNVGTDFFRGDSSIRAVNFVNALEFNRRMALTHNNMKYKQLASGKFRLAGKLDVTDALYQDNTTDSQMYVDKYIPVNNTVRYNSSVNADCSNPIVFCFWVCRSDDDSGTASANNEIKYRIASTVHFTD